MNTEELYKIYKQHPVICTDTRKLSKGCLFFALKGDNFNGNKFASQALISGASYAIVDEAEEIPEEKFIVVTDVLKALQDLASYHRGNLKIPVLGITGSNGKTTTKELTAAVLGKKFRTYYTPGNLNNHIGVPLTVLSVTDEHEFAVIEMGANHLKEIEFLCKIAMPGFGLITNIGLAHLEGFGGIEGVKKGKGELYNYLIENNGLIFIERNQPELVNLINSYSRTVSYGNNLSFDVSGEPVPGEEYLSVLIKKPFNARISTHLTGSYNFDNVMAAVAVGNYFKISPDLICEAIENYVPGNQRSQIIDKGAFKIILDAYNANPSSMEKALLNLKNSFNTSKIIALGEMLELGVSSEEEHEKIASLVATIPASMVILVGEHFRKSAEKYNYQFFKNSAEASEWLKLNKLSGSVVLIKGSRGSKMEKILEAFN